MVKKTFLGVAMAVLFLAGSSYAQDAGDQSSGSSQDQGSGGSGSHHHAPSQAAIDACSGKSDGDACDYTNAKGDDKSGTCTKTKDDQTLFCKRTRKVAS